MFKAGIYGLESWGGAKLIPGSQFGAFTNYSAIPAYHLSGHVGRFRPHDSVVTVRSDSESAPTTVTQEYDAATIIQDYSETSDGTLTVRATVKAKAAFTVFGLSRIHFDATGLTEYYPAIDMGTMFTFGRGALYPSQFSRVSGGYLLSSASTVYVDVDCEARNTVFWERYAPSHYAMHFIVDRSMSAGDEFTFRLRFSNHPFPFTSAGGDELRTTDGRPIIMCCRAMAEYVSFMNPYGWVSTNLVTQMREYISRVIAALQRHNGIGIIGWPWGYTAGFGLENGQHNYPFNSFDVPSELHRQLEWANTELSKHKLLLGGLYRPMHHRVNSRAARRFADRTALDSIAADFAVFKPDLLYLDDCGTDMHSQLLTNHHVGDFIWLLGEMRKKFGNAPLWFVEHPTAASLQYAGGYLRLERHGKELVPSIGNKMLDVLIARFPKASWLVDWSPWSSDHSQDQQAVMKWCANRGGNVSPLLKDYLVGAG